MTEVHPHAGVRPGPRDLLKLVVVGHVDHGKSTLVGRLLYDTDSLPDGKLEELQAVSARRGMALEWSFVLDSFQAERDQAVTIDTTQIRFKTDKRDYVIIDAPGHREFLKNMVSGAAEADAAVLVIDADEGVREQSRRHGYLLHLLGVRQVAVVVNKMDLVGHDRERFAQVAQEVSDYLAGIGVEPAFVLPISAREGDNVALPSANFTWFEGPTLLDALDRFRTVTRPGLQPLRMPLQDVYHFDQRRILVGRIESGVLRVGDTVLFSPSNKTGRVRSIETWNADPPVEAHAGQSVGLTLDEQLFLERGEWMSHEERPPQLTHVFRATLFWLGREALHPGKALTLKLGTSQHAVEVASIEQTVDTDSLERRQGQAVPRDGIAEVVVRSRTLMAVDEAQALQRTGRFVLLDGLDLVGGGLISMEGYPDQRTVMRVRSSNVFSVEHGVTRDQRAARNGHRGGVIWLTGLSGAGKSTLAMALERVLFERGYHVYVLDGDNVRRGLNANLGFSPDDRAENIRRVGEAAALFADAGAICITAFISPYRSDRDRARAAAERLMPGGFHEIHVAADLEICERRDPKGLYRRARSGEIQDFTGISAPYEAPGRPDLTIDTGRLSIEDSLKALAAYCQEHFAIVPR
jgi:bifunctional enzyme CysN/CysC